MATTNALSKSILILASNPKKTLKLRLDEEAREIAEGLQRSQKRERFILKQQWAVRPRDIYRSILDFRPQIIHFCGHGSGNEGLVFEDENGETKLVSAEALANLFQLFSPQVECVVLEKFSDFGIKHKLTIKYVEEGSIRIGLEGNPEDFEQLQQLFEQGKLREILGIPVEDIHLVVAENLDDAEGQHLINANLKSTYLKDANLKTDKHLKQLFTRICNNPDFESAKRRRDVNRLLVELQGLPGLLKSSHPLYLEALDLTWEWVGKNICAFEPKPHLSIQESLVRWINGSLYWRIRDLYIKKANQHSHELSLDVSINEGSENPLTLLDKLSDTGFETPTLNGIDGYIEKLRNQKIQKIFEELERYVEEDPEQIFQNCHPRKHSNCHCQFLSQKLLFKEPPEKFARINKEVGINYQALVSHWKRKCLPLLQKKLEDLGYSGVEK